MGDGKARGPISSGQSDVPDVTRGNPGVQATPQQGLTEEWIGDAYIQGKGHCAQGGDSDCFLAEGTRDRLIGAYQNRVNIAASWYGDALTQLRVGEMISKDEDIDVITALVIDALGGVALKSIVKAAKWLRGANAASVFTHEVGFAFEEGPSVIERLDKAKGANESHLNLAVKSATDQGKKAATKAALGATQGDEFEREKAVSLSYLDQLTNNAALAFQHQREDPPSMASDAELILLYHSWSAAMGHNTGMYKAELQAKLDRFKTSPASKIGRTDRRHHHAPIAKDDDVFDKTMDKMMDTRVRDTKLVMQYYADGNQPELFYYKKDYARPGLLPESVWKDPAFDLGDAALDEEFKPFQLVEKEFVDAAVSHNEAVWGVKHDVKILPAKIFPGWKPKAAVGSGVADAGPTAPSGAPAAPSVPAPVPVKPPPTLLDEPPPMDLNFTADLPIMVPE
jgi:hypothetical protein